MSVTITMIEVRRNVHYVDGGPKLRRGGSVAAVWFCSAQMCSLKESG
jgi:hypothetical protein